MKYCHRDLEVVLQNAVSQFRVIVLTGSRQTGKSTLLQRFFGNTHHYVSLDNPRDLKLAQDDPELFLREFAPPVIIDEIQYAPQLLPYIKMAVDKSSRRGQYIITGSQQFTLMKGLQETLAGRAALFQLLPMSIHEGQKSTQNYIFRSFAGSYPELVTIKGVDAQRWFGSYLSTYIEKDVQTHYRLEKTAQFRDFIFLLASRCGQILNYQSLSSDLGVSIVAVKSWVNILEATQIIYLLRPYYVNLGSRLIKAPKIYFLDTGLVNYLIGNKDKSMLTRGPYAGVLWENFVVQEILKHYCNLGERPPLYYYRTNNGLEVDVIVEERSGKIIPCEIKLTRTPQERMVRSMERLRQLNKKKVEIGEGALIAPVQKSFVLTRSAKVYNLTDFLQKVLK